MEGWGMQVNFYATLRTSAGGKTVHVALPEPSTAMAVLMAATRDKPALAGEIWGETGRIKDHIHVFVNGRQSSFLPQGLDTPLTAADSLDVFPAVGGG